MGDQVDYNALFELGDTGTESAGENEQQAAEAAESAETTEEVEETGTEEDAGEGAQETKEGTEGKPAQSADENSKYAAARRKAEAERDLAVQKAREETRAEMQAELTETIKSLGLQNPYTKQPIVDKAGLDAYKQQLDIDRKAKFAKKAGMTDEEFNSFVSDLPEVKEARAKAQQAEEAQKAIRAEQAKAEIERQMEEIRELDPSIQTLDDLRKMENYDRFYDLVKRGNTLTDAFRLATLDRTTSTTAERAKQAALNQVASKAHLERTSTRGAGSVTVPADVVAEYRAFNPDATDAEIRAHWAKYSKK